MTFWNKHNKFITMFFDIYHHLGKKKITILFFLFISSLVFRIPIIILFGDTNLEYEWLNLVNNLVLHGQLVWQTFDNGFLLPNSWMPPLYAYYLFFFTFFNLEHHNYITLILFSQVILASASVVFFYEVNKNFFSKKISFYSSLLFSIFPLHLYASSQISSISLQTFLTIVFLYLFYQLVKKRDVTSIILFSIIAGLLILLRGEFWFIFFLSLVYLFVFLKISIKKILLIILISSITASPYLIRNYLIFEKITVLQSFGYNLWKGNHPYAKENSIVEGSMIVNEKIMEKVNNIKIDNFYRTNFDKIFLNIAIENIFHDPLGHIIFGLKKVFSYIFINFKSSDPNYWNILHFLPLLIIGTTSILGIILADKKSRLFNYLVLIFLINVFIFSTVSIMPRYKLVILPLQIIFTNVLYAKIKEKYFK